MRQTEAQQTRLYYGMRVYTVTDSEGASTELTPGSEPTAEGISELLASGWGSPEDRALAGAHLVNLTAEAMIAEIDAYDTSEAVNTFTVLGIRTWLDKGTRVGLMNSLSCEKAAGLADTTLWLGTVPLTLPIDTATAMLRELELYAKECYGVTARHKAEVLKLADDTDGWSSTVPAIMAYDFKSGYPEPPAFTL